jgi:hypothetical protein
MPWLQESKMDPAKVAFVHKCLTVSHNASIKINALMQMTYTLEQWVKNKWEPQHKVAGVSLVDMCIPGAISTMATAVKQLTTLEESLPNPHFISRDWGIIGDGVSQPHPEINDQQLPQATAICDILQQFQNVFKWIILMMNLLDVSVQNSFWQEVARGEGSNIEEITSHWNLIRDGLSSVATNIQSFVTENQPGPVADSPGTGHSETLQPQARLTTLLLHLSACTL